MAAAVTVFITLSLIFLEVQCGSDLLGDGNGEFSGTMEVTQLGRHSFIRENRSIFLPCGILISPSQIVEHRWVKNWNTISSGPNLDLRLQNIGINDEGEYRCIVNVSVGIVLGPVHTLLNPVLLIQATSDPIHIHGFLNQSVVLPCPIKSVPRGEMRWLNSENSPLSERSRYKTLASGSLLILSLQPEDSGIFHCMVYNSILNDEKGVVVHLTVSGNSTEFSPLILDTFPENLTLSSETEKFYCIGNGNPLPMSTWTRAYSLLDDVFFNHPQTEHTSLGNLIWLNKENGSTRYDCIASVGSEQVTKSMDTHAPPSFPNLRTLNYPAAKTVRFECKATTMPLIWYKDGELLHTNNGRVKARNNELIISNTIESDSGFYQCESSNYIGTGRLIIEPSPEKPSPPVDATCISSTSRSIQLNWKIQSGVTITAYTVHYMPLDGGSENQGVTNNTSISIQYLKPKTNYSIYVRAYGSKAASEQSERIYCSTSLDDSSGKPNSLQFHVVGNNSVILSWEMPTGSTGTILSYAVEVTNTSNQKNESSVIMTNTTSVTLTNLAENTNYFVRVMAERSGGGPLGEYSSTIVFRISNKQNQSLNLNTTSTSSTTSEESSQETSLSPNSTVSNDFLGSEQNLGLVLGTLLGLASIIICGTIIICRNRCFSFLLRRGRTSRRGSYIATPTSGKDTVDSAPLEMKVLTTHLDTPSQHLDTKGGHPNVDHHEGVCDPLVGDCPNRVRVDVDMSSS